MDYRTVIADELLERDLRALVRLAVDEDVRSQCDWTTVCLVDPSDSGRCHIVPRQAGICAGLVTIPWIIDEWQAELKQELLVADGEPLVPGQPVAAIEGNVRDLLVSERTILNIVSRLSGIATLTHRYVEAIAGTDARLYDTRKTTPGWRLLEKYAVHCGGGYNHRSGLYDGFLIKDNHLALAGPGDAPLPAAEAARRAAQWRGRRSECGSAPMIVEVEVDSIEQLREVIPVGPDIVLLDNFTIEEMKQAVSLRSDSGASIELEASGNVTIDTIAEIASTGVDRISSGALTHQATSLDLGMDWIDGGGK